MKNNFAEEYKRKQEIEDQYNAADKANDEAGREAARKAYATWQGSIAVKGEDYARIYTRYEESRDCGNEYIDFRDTIQDNRVENLVKSLRKYGIEKFTFSSGWSSAVETAWLFVQNGCRVEGMVEINTPYKPFMSDEYEKAHGYLFSIV